MKPALLIIDLQKYFYNLDKKKFDDKIVKNIPKLLCLIRALKIKIVHIKTIYKYDKSNWPDSYKERDQMWCMENTEDAEIIESAFPIEDEEIIIKNRFSAFYKTKLKDTLIRENIDTLIIAGYSADVCVRLTTLDAFNEGYKIYWLPECIESAFEPYCKSEEYIKNLTKLNTIRIDDIIELIHK
jgi:ureidoacrylate peracid hydrolase